MSCSTIDNEWHAFTPLYMPTPKWVSSCVQITIASRRLHPVSKPSYWPPPPPFFPMPADLPREAWRMVFGYLTTQISPINHSEFSAEALWKNSTFPDPHSARDFPIPPHFMGRRIPYRLWKPEFKSSTEALIAVQVCHAWYDLGLEFL